MNKMIFDIFDQSAIPDFSILEKFPDAVLLVDADGRIAHVNTAFAHLFGYDNASLMGCSLDMLLSSPEKQHHNLVLQFIRKDQGTKPHDMRSARIVHGRKADGTVVPVSVSLSSFLVSGEKFGLAVIRDQSVTERLNRALEEKAWECARAETVQTEFFRHITHDFRAKLNLVIGFSELIKAGDTPHHHEEYAGYIYENGKQLLQLLQRITTAFPSGQFYDTQDHLLDIRDFLLNHSEPWSAMVANRKHNIDLIVPQQAILARIDTGTLAFCMNTLIHNVMSHCPPQRNIRISLEQHDDTVQIVVEDDGPGLSSERLAQLGKPHNKATSPIQENGNLGLSLYLVCTRLHNCGGGITFSAAPLGGLQAILTLPSAAGSD